MSTKLSSETVISRTERGLTITGTRITLYDVMDYLKAGWPPGLIQNWLNLDAPRIDAVLAYIENHRAEVETEYQQVLKNAQKNREYWENRNRDGCGSFRTTSDSL